MLLLLLLFHSKLKIIFFFCQVARFFVQDRMNKEHTGNVSKQQDVSLYTYCILYKKRIYDRSKYNDTVGLEQTGP